MAIYQVTIEFIPETWANNNNYNPLALYEEDENIHDSSIAWEGFIHDFEINDISKILPPGKSWSKKILAWGNSESNDIEIFFNENKKIESFSVRIDFREDFNYFLGKIVELANKLNCVFFIPEFKKIINAEYQLTAENIANSYASRFNVNPIKFLNELAKK